MAKFTFGRALCSGAEAALLRALLWNERRELDYHPLPNLTESKAGRASGSFSRLKSITALLAAEISSPTVAMDVGSHIGFFSLSLVQRGWFVYSIERDQSRLLLSFLLAQQEKRRLAAVPLRIDLDNVHYLPEADVTLCLSVWHHWVRRYGFTNATAILEALIGKTRRLMFFDAGEEEMPASYHLPYDREPGAAFLAKYLRELKGVGQVRDLGRHQAMSPPDDGGRRRDVLRTLFCLQKADYVAD